MAENDVRYTVGDEIELELEFYDVTGTLFDPTSISLRVYNVREGETTYTNASPGVTNPSVGTWIFPPHELTEPGEYSFVIASQQPGSAAAENIRIYVLPQLI